MTGLQPALCWSVFVSSPSSEGPAVYACIQAFQSNLHFKYLRFILVLFHMYLDFPYALIVSYPPFCIAVWHSGCKELVSDVV